MKRRADEYQRQLELEKARRQRLYKGTSPLKNLEDKVSKVPQPKLGDLELFKKGKFSMKELKERQGMADLAKFKDAGNFEEKKEKPAPKKDEVDPAKAAQ
jgi:hypothetical protein